VVLDLFCLSYPLTKSKNRFYPQQRSVCQVIPNFRAEMSRLSYFAIQIQARFFQTQSKSNHSLKFYSNVQSKSKWSPKNLKNPAFSQQKRRIYFLIIQSKSSPGPKIWSDLQPGSNPNSTNFAIVQIQSNSSLVQCSSLL